MPNFAASSLNEISYPTSKNGISFLWEAKSDNESLILTKFQNYEFFLQKNKKNNGFLLKVNKHTRSLDTEVLKKALIAYKELSNAKLIHSNIYSKKVKKPLKDEYVKNIDFFTQKYEFEQEIWLEIGFGSGRHLLYQAKTNPNILYIGIEIHKPSLNQTSKRCKAEKLENVYLVDTDARVLLQSLASNSVGKIFVHFPVPWDKKPHRRVISKEFLNDAIRVLKKDGTLEVRTDSENYFKFTTDVFLGTNKSEFKIRKNIEIPITSKYEDRWRKQEKNIYDIIFKNKIISREENKKEILKFDIDVNLELISSKFEKFTKIGDDWFLSIQKIYKYPDGIILKLAFGSKNKPENKFLIVEKTKVSYFAKTTLGTKANIKAHNALKEWLISCK